MLIKPIDRHVSRTLYQDSLLLTVNDILMPKEQVYDAMAVFCESFQVNNEQEMQE